MNFLFISFFYLSFFDRKDFFIYNNDGFAGRDARVAEWGGLEHHYTRKGIGGSNPPPAAMSEANGARRASQIDWLAWGFEGRSDG